MLYRSFEGAFGAEDLPAPNPVRDPPNPANVGVGEVDLFFSVLSLLGSMTSEGRVTVGPGALREDGVDVISTSSTSSTMTGFCFAGATGGDLTVRCFLGGEGCSSSDTSSTVTDRFGEPLIPFVAGSEPFNRVLRRCTGGEVTLFSEGLTPMSSGGGRDRLLPYTTW